MCLQDLKLSDTEWGKKYSHAVEIWTSSSAVMKLEVVISKAGSKIVYYTWEIPAWKFASLQNC